ncbi:MAG: class I SAM-dependent methyltransferase [Thermoplasmatota archaeon]
MNEGEIVKGTPLTLSVVKIHAESVRERVMEKELFDPDRYTTRSDGEVHFPIIIPRNRDRDWVRGILGPLSDFTSISGDLSLTVPGGRTPNPYEKARLILGDHMTEEELTYLPDRWEKVGDCIVLSLGAEIMERKIMIAKAYIEATRSRFCLLNRGGVGGELRIPDVEILIPPADGSTEVVHREGGISYVLDPTRIMFSSGNTGERRRSARYIDENPAIPSSGETGGMIESEDVLDMFAGIGYFTLPIGKNTGCGSVTACEKNPVSFEYLIRNIELNGLSGKVKPILGDNRESLPERFADRIVMGYVGGTIDYLDRALHYLRDRGGIIHLHDTVKVEDGPGHLFELSREIASDHGYEAELLGSRRVKSYAPRIDHVVLDIRFIAREQGKAAARKYHHGKVI